MIKITYELEMQIQRNLWNEARNAEGSSLDSKEGDAFKTYLNNLVNKAFKAGIDFHQNLKEEITY